MQHNRQTACFYPALSCAPCPSFPAAPETCSLHFLPNHFSRCPLFTDISEMFVTLNANCPCSNLATESTSTLLTTCEAARHNFGCVCVCVCQTITFESLNVGSSYLHMRHISMHYGSSSYMKVIGSRTTSQESKRSKIPIPTM